MEVLQAAHLVNMPVRVAVAGADRRPAVRPPRALQVRVARADEHLALAVVLEFDLCVTSVYRMKSFVSMRIPDVNLMSVTPLNSDRLTDKLPDGQRQFVAQ